MEESHEKTIFEVEAFRKAADAAHCCIFVHRHVSSECGLVGKTQVRRVAGL